MVTLEINTSTGAYPVVIGRGLLSTAGERVAARLGKLPRVFVVTSPNIDALWGEPLRASFRNAGATVETLTIPPGEEHKRLSTVERLTEELAAHGANRDSLLVALGGGVIGDITGFLAAVYMRGLRFVQVPTTLLAQVDSSVGGKTGVNLAAGKNLVGSFHHPIAVLADIDTLSTLPPRELRAGLQESVKSAVIRDAGLFDFMEANADRILAGNADALEHVVEASVRVKAAVVQADEREGGLRMILNFGHTIGHAIEAATEYKGMLHGEAVGWGMIAALRLAESRGMMEHADVERCVALIHRYADLPRFYADADRLVALSSSDKKNRDGMRVMVIPTGIGRIDICRDITTGELTSATQTMLEEMRGRSAGTLAGSHA